MKVQAVKNAVLAALAAAGGFISERLGGWDGALALLVSLMAADYVTGLLVALVFRRSGKTAGGGASSSAGFRGIVKKAMILVLVGVGAALDAALGTGWARTAVIFFFAANEGLSILENTALMGVPYPAALRSALEALGEKAEKK
ncbi:MAG: phage holin family protein [Oscillospiraceae bacterium]|jgi:toxin secretion/phage lysis holin|nr:phage holin family protein [Oscillospiraceae bacterium]